MGKSLTTDIKFLHNQNGLWDKQPHSVTPLLCVSCNKLRLSRCQPRSQLATTVYFLSSATTHQPWAFEKIIFGFSKRNFPDAFSAILNTSLTLIIYCSTSKTQQKILSLFTTLRNVSHRNCTFNVYIFMPHANMFTMDYFEHPQSLMY